MGPRRGARRGRARPRVTADGDGYLVGLELEAKLFGRVRLLTIEATAAVRDGTGVVLDVAPPRALGPGHRRAGLEEAAAMVREAREMLTVAAGPPR